MIRSSAVENWRLEQVSQNISNFSEIDLGEEKFLGFELTGKTENEEL